MNDLSNKETKLLILISLGLNALLSKFYLDQFSLIIDIYILVIYVIGIFVFVSLILFFLFKKVNKLFLSISGATVAILLTILLINFGRTNHIMEERYMVQEYKFEQTNVIGNSIIRKLELVSTDDSEKKIFVNGSYEFNQPIKKGDELNMTYYVNYFHGLNTIKDIEMAETRHSSSPTDE